MRSWGFGSYRGIGFRVREIGLRLEGSFFKCLFFRDFRSWVLFFVVRVLVVLMVCLLRMNFKVVFFFVISFVFGF